MIIERIMERLARIVQRFPVMFVIIFLILTGMFAIPLPNIEMTSDLEDFMPEHEVARANNIVEEDFGTSEMVLIVAKSDNVLSKDILCEILETENLIRKDPDISKNLIDRKIFGIADAISIALSHQNTTLCDSSPDQLNLTIEMVLNKDVQLQAMLSDDLNIASHSASSSVIIVFINGSLSKSEQEYTASLIKEIISSRDNLNVDYGLFSNLLVGPEIDKLTISTFSILIVLCAILISIILAIKYRNISDVFFTLFGLGMAIVFTFGSAVILNLSINILTIFTTMLIIGIGVDFAIHIIHRYRDEKLHKREEPMITALKYTGSAILLATIATVAGFITSIISPIPPIQDFGIMISIGIINCFLIFTLFLPSVLILVDRFKDSRAKIKNSIKNEKKNKILISKRLGKISEKIAHKPFIPIIIVLCLSMPMAYGTINVETDFSMIDFMPDDIPVKKTLDYLLDHFPNATMDQVYIVIEGDITDPELLDGLYLATQNMDNTPKIAKRGNFSTVESVLTLINMNVRTDVNLSILVDHADTDGDGIPDDNLTEIYDCLLLTNSDAKKFIHRDGENYDMMLIRMFTDTKGATNKEVMELVDNLHDDMKPVEDFADVTITGQPVIESIISSSIQKGMIISSLIAILVCSIILMIVFRSVKYGLISTIPILLVCLWVIGSMYYMSLSLNIMTAMMVSFSIGVGVPYVIHVTHRYREESTKTNKKNEIIGKTISGTGPALLGAAVTTIVGTGILSFAPIPPLATFGLFAAICVSLALIFTLFLLPALLNLIKEK